MPVGRVRWFNAKKGFGFIADERGGDVFLHHSQIQHATPIRLHEGDVVQYEEAPGEKGPRAVRVVKQ